jgi:hypothetical protein
MLHSYIFSCLLALVAGQDTFFAINKVCEGWLCETEHIDIITFSAQETSSYKTLQTIFPSADYDQVEKVQVLSTYDSTSRTYYVLLQDPSDSKATLWAYSLSNNKATQVPTTFGASNLNFDPKSKSIMASYGGKVYLVSPSTGLRKPSFDVFSSSEYPNYISTPVSFWAPSSTTFSEVVIFNTVNPVDRCYHVYLVNAATNKTVISQCFPDDDAGSSLTDYETLFIQQLSGGFFAVTYNVLGANYKFVYPQNYTTISTVLDFQVSCSFHPVTNSRTGLCRSWVGSQS